ncbi:MAG TPA: hypothetical protein VEI04_02305 [Syntrophobacteria bacterium]|nr:hypothetical protein [Syntrophobacteria bacterium]
MAEEVVARAARSSRKDLLPEPRIIPWMVATAVVGGRNRMSATSAWAAAKRWACWLGSSVEVAREAC